MRQTQRAVRLSAFVLAAVAAATPALAWGPRAQEAIVLTAARLLSQQENIPLSNLERDIRRGASASQQEIESLVPGAYSNLRQAIESQMVLLQAVRGDRIDPYTAYRLGVLGKLVAQYTAPMAEADPTYRNLYYADVDKNIGTARLATSRRRPVDNEIYLETARREAQARSDLITRDYREGVGFGGVAKGSLSQEAGRSVDAVADVWYTILRSQSAVGGVSDRQLREYNLRALDFFLQRKSKGEARRVRELLTSGEISADLRARIGDMYFEAGDFEEAVQEYRAALELDPGRKDIVQKVSAYYLQKGDEALADEELEAAAEAYAQAQEFDRANPDAQTKRQEAEHRIAQRQSRLEAAQRAIAEAQGLEQQAAQLQARNQYGEALDLLQQARVRYLSVPAEFEAESLTAQRGLGIVDNTSRELKSLLVQSTDRLSGSAFGVEARRMAKGTATSLQKEAFQALLEEGYKDEMDELKRQVKETLDRRAEPAP